MSQSLEMSFSVGRASNSKCVAGNLSKRVAGSGGEMSDPFISQLAFARQPSCSAVLGQVSIQVLAHHALLEQAVIGLSKWRFAADLRMT